MPLFRTILIAADFSEGSRASFRVACAIARAAETRAIVLYVAEPMYVAPAVDHFGPQSARFSIVERDPGYYKALTDRLREVYTPGHPLQIEYAVRVGAVADELLREAQGIGADLIVLGTHGRTGLHRLLAGSVAEAVLRQAPCPVLALRSPDPKREFGEIRVILHPTDFSENSADALRVARDLAREEGARLVLLNVIPSEITAEGMALMPVDPVAFRKQLDELRGRLDGPDLKFPVQTLVREGMSVVTEILHAADTLGGDLIVMGTHGRTGLGRLLMGSVAEGVLRHSSCPVLTVRAALPAGIPSTERTAPASVGS
jgi:nucleotide-binding universal stress UspA family protein